MNHTTQPQGLPALNLNPGERYAGPVLDAAGQLKHHSILLPARPPKRAPWQAQMDWAASVGGHLPDRQEQPLLYANCKDALPPAWCWSGQEHEKDASYAWLCFFNYGHEYCTRKSYEGSAVAVRRLVLESFSPSAAEAAPRRSTPHHWQAKKRLYRAIVTLPQSMCPKGEPLHERIVLFDGPETNPGEYLETLLAHAWHADTFGWSNDGSIYSLQSAAQLVEEGLSEDLNARLFETGWGGAEPIGYANGSRVDLFVAPILKAALLETLARVSTAARSAA